MIIIRDPAQIPYDQNVSLGFVPTMGALHAGHISLVELARKENDLVAVSIFVNPTQFGPNEDFTKYPRPFEKDCELAEAAGVNIIFAPEREQMYPSSPSMIHVPVVSELYEGSHRPGHFDGVATVVSKLFNIIRPNVAYFGQKDLQQCAVISKMVKDFNFQLDLKFGETLREKDGLAMSSRNTYLSPEERSVAPNIYKSLVQLRDQLPNSDDIPTLLSVTIESLTSAGFQVDYLDVVDKDTVHPVREINTNSAIIFAGRIGKTRLIDNIRFG